ncbi:MAG: hypothetical protein COW30_17645 [Rhodospirillales bacterium CG15_BIG_FIL_POST_REV_8_21_14_020_66_15]|nr:MAG: hypothetical protein COW30_17645 [Rhodospirillales bacterium CG15_BIG_FIL_POST_REV_8_21_14_020_66_15]
MDAHPGILHSEKWTLSTFSATIFQPANTEKNIEMAKIKSERHHWWPECVSNFWGDDNGMVHWILPDGTVKGPMPPKNLGVIGNGHHIKFAYNGANSPWDECFEPAFHEADTNFPAVINWLDSLAREARPDARDRTRVRTH